jgi:hypothetical protein
MDRWRIEVIDMIIDILSIAVGTLLLTMSVLALYGLECEKSERRKRYMNGETDYYGNKLEDDK